jgi:hypothetical protein
MSRWIAQYEPEDDLRPENASAASLAEIPARNARAAAAPELPHPPGPTGLARIYTHLRMILDPLGTPVKLFARYGDVVRLNQAACLVCNPDMVDPNERDYYALGKDISQT